MIRFKQTPASAVPVPPAEYATLFVDAATGLPAAKDSTGTVIPLKGADGADGAAGADGDPGADGTGLPNGGTVGQIVTRTADGAEWADAPAGGAPSGTWTNMLPPDGEAKDNKLLPLAGAATSGAVLIAADFVEVWLFRAVGEKTAIRLRGSVTVVLDVTKTDSGQPEAGSYVLHVANEQFPLAAGTSVVAFDFDVPANYGDASHDGAHDVDVYVECMDETNVRSAWASLEVTQCDYLLNDSGTVTTDPLTMTPIPVIGAGVFGSGGFTIAKTGDLASVTAIDIVGYYNTAKYAGLWLDGDPAPMSMYAPRWIDEADYVALGTAITIPTGSPDWASGHVFDLPDMNMLPDFDPEAVGWSGERNTTLCKVTLDGGAPVLALIDNREAV